MFCYMALCIRSCESAGLLVVCIVMVQMVGDRPSPGASILGVVVMYIFCHPSLSGLADRFRTTWWIFLPVHRDGCFSALWTVYEFAFDVAASFLTLCRGSRILRPCRCGDFGLVSRQKQAEHR